MSAGRATIQARGRFSVRLGQPCLSTAAASLAALEPHSLAVCAPTNTHPSCIGLGHIRKNGTTHMGFRVPLQEQGGLSLGKRTEPR